MTQKTEGTRKNYDGGLAWLLVLGTFGIQCFGIALQRSYGVLLPMIIYYFDTTYSRAAWISGLTSFNIHLASPIVTTLGHHYGCRPVVLVGGLLAFSGMMASAWVPSIDYLTLTYGVLFGMGVSVALGPPLVMISQHFEKRRGSATVLSFTGSGLSGIIFPPLIGYMEREYSLRGCLFLVAGLCLHMLVFGMLIHDFWTVKKPDETVEQVKAVTNQPKARVNGVSTDHKTEHNNNLPGKDGEKNGNHYGVSNKEESAGGKGAVFTISTSDIEQQRRQSVVSQSRRISSVSRRSNAFIDEKAMRRFSSFSQSRRPSKASLQSVALDDTDVTLVGFKQLESNKSSEPIHLGVNELLIDSILPTSCTSLTQYKDEDTFHQSCCNCIFLGKVCFQCNAKDPRPAFIDLSLLKDKVFLVYALSLTMSYVCILGAFNSLVSHAEDKGVKQATGQLMLSVIAGLNIVSRVFFGWFIDTQRVHVILIYVFLLVGQGGSVILLSFASDRVLLWTFTACFGLMGSTSMSLNSVVLANVLGVERLHSSYGLNGLFQASGAISFPYFLGLMRDLYGSWDSALLLVGLLSIGGGLCILTEGLVTGRVRRKKKESTSL